VNDRVVQNYRKASLLAAAGILFTVPFVLGASFAAAEGITWQVTRQTHLERFHALRMQRMTTRVVRKKADSELAADLRTANEYTAGEKNMRLELMLAFAAGLTAVTAVLFWAFLASPTKRLLALCGARPAGDEEREALHILEDLSLAAGLIPPELFVIDTPLPNAFSLGMTAEHGVIAVTQGLLMLLEKRELEAVLAHELSHIAQQDTRPNMMAAAFAALLGKHGQALSRVVTARTVSRHNEFLADADAAQLTGYPEGLRRALGKLAIGATPDADWNPAIAHLCFAQAEPPIAERIAQLGRSRDLVLEPALTTSQLAFSAGFAVVVFGGLFVLLLRFGGN
jgi:Zn-dependent protease with chaperone function